MNFYFGIRVLSYFTTIIGAFLITFSIWSVFYSWSSTYHHYLDIPRNFFQILIANGIKCARDMSGWSEWGECDANTTESTRSRISASCVKVVDKKPCICPIAKYCKDKIFEAVNTLNIDCIESILDNFNDTDNTAFIVHGTAKMGSCKAINLPLVIDDVDVDPVLEDYDYY